MACPWFQGIGQRTTGTCTALERFRGSVNVYYREARPVYRDRVPEAAPFGKLPARDELHDDSYLPVYGPENEFFRPTPSLDGVDRAY